MARTLVFDLGGVVLRWQPIELLSQSLPARAGCANDARELSEKFFQAFRPGCDWAEYDRGHLSTGEVVQRISLRTGLLRDEVERVMRAIPAHLQLRSDSALLLQQLQDAGHRLVYLSNMPAPLIEHALQQLRRLAVFELGVFSSEVGMVKPEDEIYHHALEHFGCAAADCLFFDDNAVNVDVANRLGWQAHVFSNAETARLAIEESGLLPAARHTP